MYDFPARYTRFLANNAFSGQQRIFWPPSISVVPHPTLYPVNAPVKCIDLFESFHTSLQENNHFQTLYEIIFRVKN